MTISVLGSGAVGTLVGGLLRASGRTVEFARKAGAKTSCSGKSVRIVLPDGWIQAEGFGRARARREEDLNIVALARNRLRGLKKEDFRAVSGPAAGHTIFCNCDPQEPARLGLQDPSRSFMLTLMEAVKLQEGEVELMGPAVFVLQKDSPAAGLVGDFTRCGIAVQTVDDVVPFLDAFFVYQLLWLPVAMCNTTVRHFLSFPEGRELARRILSEGLAAMKKAGRRIAKLPVMDPEELLLRLGRKAASFEAARDAPDRSYPPALQAMIKGRQTEARELNNKAVEIAATAGLNLPWNWKIYQKAGRAVGVGFYRGPAELLKSLG